MERGLRRMRHEVQVNNRHWLSVALGAVTFMSVVVVPSIAHAQVVVVDEEPYCRAHWWGVGRCWHPHHARPTLTFGGELGIAHLEEGGPFGFETSTGRVTDTGPAWGLRVGVDFVSWLGIEAHYIGAYNPGNSNAPNVGYAMTGGEAVVRLALPTPFIRPYVFGGIGVYDFELVGNSPAGNAMALHSSSQAGVPMGVGLELMLSWHVSVAVEGAYRFQIGESFSNNDAVSGADMTTLTGVMRFRL